MKSSITSRTTRRSRAAAVVALTLSIVGGGLATAAPATAGPGDVVNPLPSKSYRYSSEFGARCIPVVNGSTDHLGQDMGAPDGTTIRAIADGTVTTVQDPVNGQSGYLGIRHVIDGKVTYSGYYHMWKASQDVKVGQQVTKGQRVGRVGSSGPSTGPHLHFEIWSDAFHGTGTAIDPTPWMKAQGIDLKADASWVSTIKTPPACTYYSGSPTALRATPSATGRVLRNVTVNTKMTSVPGSASQSGAFVKVSVSGVTGWVARNTVYPNPVSTTTPANVSYETTDNLNVRTSASVDYPVVRNLPLGTRVTTTGQRSGTWFQVKAGSTIGWVSSSFLKKVTIAPAATTTTVSQKSSSVQSTAANVKYRTTARLNLRKAASANQPRVRTLPQGFQVTTTGLKSGSWLKVRAGNSSIGWVHSAYLAKAASASSPSPSPAPAPTKSTSPKPPASVAYRTTSRLNLRRAAAYSQPRVRTLPQDFPVVATGQTSGSWLKVRAGNSTVGWVHSKHLTR